MSGIIGGAGSKSGVIGTTELEYEEGTWTSPNGAVNGITMVVDSSSGEYTKIGQQVFLRGYVLFGAHTDDDNPSYSAGLPFTPKSGTYAYGTVGEVGRTVSGTDQTDGSYIEIRNGENFFRWGKNASSTYSYLARKQTRSVYFAFSISYITA